MKFQPYFSSETCRHSQKRADFHLPSFFIRLGRTYVQHQSFKTFNNLLGFVLHFNHHTQVQTHFPMVTLPPQLLIVKGLDMVTVSLEEPLLIPTVPPFIAALTPSASVLYLARA